MKITNLKVQNFKAFYGEIDKPYEFDFLGKDGNAKNILLYGENGSGKSSLYWTLHHALTTTDTNILKKYKNIFAKKEKISIKIEMDFDNGKKFVYDESTVTTVDPDMQEEFDRLAKVKTFLTYRSLYFINELFSKKLSLEQYLEAFSLVYGKEIRIKLSEYYDLQKDFWKEYVKVHQELDTLLEDFSKQFKVSSLAKNFIHELEEDEEFSWYASEGGKTYNNVKYFSVNANTTLQELIMELDVLNSVLDFDNPILSTLKSELEKIFTKVEERSETEYWMMLSEEKFAASDSDVVESIDLVDQIKDYLGSLLLLSNTFGEGAELINVINSDLKEKLSRQIVDINKILLKYYNSNIVIEDIICDKLNFEIKDNFNKYAAKFKIKSVGELVPHNHTKFLNEAKLSSINFAFYISIIKSYAELRELKLLVLDDLLVSLDMSSREIVLNILEEYFSQYQIIILTHDRAFFEMARRKLKVLKQDSAWIEYEMFEDSSGDIPKPLIIPFKNNLEKAEAYFKICDYPTAETYLRKASEEILDSMLLDTFKPNDKSGLDGMIQSYKYMCGVFGIDIPVSIICLQELTKRVFNPSSHDDLVNPLYKKEIHDAIRLVRRITRLPKIEVIDTSIKQGSLLTFKYEDKYEAFYRFLGDVQLYTYGDKILNRDSILLSKSGHKILVDREWEEHVHGGSESFTLKTIFGRNKNYCESTLLLPEIDVMSFIDHVLINDSILEDDIKSLIERQISV